MPIPLQITFQGCEPSDTVRASIEREFARLQTHDHHLASGRVTVIGPSDHHKHGTGFEIHILLSLPPHQNIVISHAASDARRHEHAEAAVKDAFAAVRRRIDDFQKS